MFTNEIRLKLTVMHFTTVLTLLNIFNLHCGWHNCPMNLVPLSPSLEGVMLGLHGGWGARVPNYNILPWLLLILYLPDDNQRELILRLKLLQITVMTIHHRPDMTDDSLCKVLAMIHPCLLSQFLSLQKLRKLQLWPMVYYARCWQWYSLV